MLLPWVEKGVLMRAEGVELPYAIVGDGPQPVVVVPSAGDGMTLVTDAALRLAFYCRGRARRHRLLVLSRRQPVREGFTVEQQAADMLWALAQLGWRDVTLECSSAGRPGRAVDGGQAPHAGRRAYPLLHAPSRF